MLNRGKTGPRRSATIGDRRGGCSHRVVERRRQSRRVVVEANRRCEIGITYKDMLAFILENCPKNTFLSQLTYDFD